MAPDIFQTGVTLVSIKVVKLVHGNQDIVQELCESRGGGRPGLSVLTSLLVSVDVKLY